tara:strand:+ start:444 stop:1574 length:1131 start_codon:yes stop_codon:yes gene_type:complete
MNRRDFIKTTAATAVAYTMGHSVFSSASDSKLGNILVILLRGGMDGLTAAQPLQDKRIFDIRRSCIVENTLQLDGKFGLHPSMKNFSDRWNAGNAGIVHATGFDYYGRSHFEGQNLMEGGGGAPYATSTGWLGRAMEVSSLSSLALTLPTPLICKSTAITESLYPSNFSKNPFADNEMLLEGIWKGDMALSKHTKSTLKSYGRFDRNNQPEHLAREVAKQMSQVGGPKVGFVEYSGFDTHSSQGGEHGDHARHLRKLDKIIHSFASYSKEVWNNSIVITVTEFGRTAKENGTKGTDHGAASAIFLAGGLIKSSKVITDWPGLDKKELFEKRDLRQTTDARDVYGDVIHHAFNISKQKIKESVFPGTQQKLNLDIWG